MLRAPGARPPSCPPEPPRGKPRPQSAAPERPPGSLSEALAPLSLQHPPPDVQNGVRPPLLVSRWLHTRDPDQTASGARLWEAGCAREPQATASPTPAARRARIPLGSRLACEACGREQKGAPEARPRPSPFPPRCAGHETGEAKRQGARGHAQARLGTGPRFQRRQSSAACLQTGPWLVRAKVPTNQRSVSSPSTSPSPRLATPPQLIPEVLDTRGS